MIRASCRSDGRVDLAGTLDACGDLFVRLGGHAAAAGFELPVERWDAFTDRFLERPPPPPRRTPAPPLALDLALPAAYVDYGLYRDLARLAPCGPGNPEPLVAVLGLTVQRVRAANGGHTQLVLRRERDVLDGIAFGRADLATSVVEGQRVDVVARLASRAFGGLETLQLEVRDVAHGGPTRARPRSSTAPPPARRSGRCAPAGRGAGVTARRARPRRRRPSPSGPVRAAARGRPIAAALAIAGLLIIGFVDAEPARGSCRSTRSAGGQRPGGSGDIPARTPDPVERGHRARPSRRARDPGHAGLCQGRQLWVQTGGKATQLTGGGNDSMPSFSQDGKAVYFVRTRRGRRQLEHRRRDQGLPLDVPALMRVPVGGSHADRLLDGLVDPAGGFKWMGFIREPVVSPDGRYVAIATDLPDPTNSDVTLKLLNPEPQDQGPRARPGPAARPPGPGLEARRQRLPTSATTATAPKGTPRSTPTPRRPRRPAAVTGPGYLQPAGRRTGSTSRRPGRPRSARTS